MTEAQASRRWVASDVMTREVVAVEPTTPVAQILAAFRRHSIGGVLVVDHGRLAGIVTEGDILARIARDAPHLDYASYFALTLPTMLYPGDDATLAERLEGLRRLTARDIMTARVVTVTADTPVTEVARQLMKHRIKRVPVVDAGKVVGVVARGDIVRRIGALDEA